MYSIDLRAQSLWFLICQSPHVTLSFSSYFNSPMQHSSDFSKHKRHQPAAELDKASVKRKQEKESLKMQKEFTLKFVLQRSIISHSPLKKQKLGIRMVWLM